MITARDMNRIMSKPDTFIMQCIRALLHAGIYEKQSNAINMDIDNISKTQLATAKKMLKHAGFNVKTHLEIRWKD